MALKLLYSDSEIRDASRAKHALLSWRSAWGRGVLAREEILELESEPLEVEKGLDARRQALRDEIDSLAALEPLWYRALESRSARR